MLIKNMLLLATNNKKKEKKNENMLLQLWMMLNTQVREQHTSMPRCLIKVKNVYVSSTHGEV